MDERTGFIFEKMPKSKVEDLALEEVPDVSYGDIGGLESQIEALRDAVELPYLHADLFKEHKLIPPKGVLLYGPPGCGKTMVAKAVANELAKKASEMKGETVKGYFLNIKGPELLNKYVGETERKIREVFSKATEKAREDMPVVIFFDEMDSLFQIRGSGISSDVNLTIVPTLLAEIDGVESLKNIIVIGASNRQDLIEDFRVDLEKRGQRIVVRLGEDLFGHRAGHSVGSRAASITFREPPGVASLVASNDKVLADKALAFGQRALKLCAQDSVDRIGGQRTLRNGDVPPIVQCQESRLAGTV